jgi:hypothetical protein
MKRLLYDNTRISFILKIVFILVVSVLIETFVFNFRFFLPRLFNAPRINIPSSAFTDVYGADRTVTGLNGSVPDVSFTIPDVGVPVYSIKLNLSGDYSYLNAAINYEDDNFSNSYLDAGSWDIRPALHGSSYIHFITSGNCRSITVKLSQITGGSVNITSVDVNSEYFHFSLLRFLLLLSVLLLIFITLHFKLWEKAFSPNNLRQTIAAAAILTAAICFALMVFYFNNSTDKVVSRDIQTDKQDSYQYLTQSFYNGQLNFTVDPPQSLQSLDNPYDSSKRTGDFLWDSIYFKGKYYSYFGIAPVILLLLPFKLLTGYYLSTSIACLIFTIIAMIAAFLLYLNIIRVWFKNINLLMFFSGLSCVCFSNIFWLIARPSFYELAEASAIAFLLLALNMLFNTLRSGRARGVKLLLSGTFFGLMVASRPTFIFFIAAALPFLVKIIFKDAAGFKKRLLFCLDFLFPLGLFAIILGVYNYLRFGSPFNFGIDYQLTVSNVKYNSVTNFVQSLNGFYHYFLQPLNFDLRFPFFHVVSSTPSSAAEYSFNFPIAGIFSFPVMLSLPAAVYIIKRRMNETSIKKWFVVILLLVSILIAYLDITLAGVLMRYTLDIYTALLFCALILWLEVYGYFSQRGAAAPVTKLFSAITVATVVITCFTCIVGEDNLFSQSSPQLYQYISGLFEFWR